MTNTPQSPIEVVRAFNAAMEKMDFDAGLQYIAENCEYSNGPLGTLHGPAGVRAMLEPFFAPMLENTFVILREAVNGAVVMLERLDRHRLPTGWIQLPVTGVYEVHNGRITVWHEYFDVATIQKQMPAA
jgi:limonene-1,2-epoxide hydrolase